MQGYDKGSRLTRHEVLSRIQERTGRVMDDLTPPKVSPEIMYLWAVYLEIRQGAVAIGYQELESYQSVTGNELSPFEAGLLLEIDMTRLNHD